MSGTHALGLSCADSSALLAEYLARPADLRPRTTAFISSPWLNIPPTHGLIFLRFDVHAQFRGSKVSRCYGFLDIVDLIIDNWVMIVILHILDQCGLHVLEDLRYTADPTLPRWPS